MADGWQTDLGHRSRLADNAGRRGAEPEIDAAISVDRVPRRGGRVTTVESSIRPSGSHYGVVDMMRDPHFHARACSRRSRSMASRSRFCHPTLLSATPAARCPGPAWGPKSEILGTCWGCQMPPEHCS